MYTKAVHLVAAGSAGVATANDDFGSLDDSEVMAVAIHFSGAAAPGTTEVKITGLDPSGEVITLVDYTGTTSQGWLRIAGPTYDVNLVPIAGVYLPQFINGVVKAEVDTANPGVIVDISLILREMG